MAFFRGIILKSLADVANANDLKQFNINADVAELADALDLGSSVFDVGVQVPSSAPNSRNPNLVPIGEGFGFLLYLDYPNFNSKLEKQ